MASETIQQRGELETAFCEVCEAVEEYFLNFHADETQCYVCGAQVELPLSAHG